ncbi:MAG: hypothetical protein WDO19_06180 [Bacteroidota bacterium]
MGKQRWQKRLLYKYRSTLKGRSWKAVNPDNPYDTVAVYDLIDPTKIIDHRIVKVDGYTLKHGTWTYYDPASGRVDKTEHWYHDKPAAETADGELAPIDVADNTTVKSDSARKYPKPQAIIDFERKRPKRKTKYGMVKRLLTIYTNS